MNNSAELAQLIASVEKDLSGWEQDVVTPRGKTDFDQVVEHFRQFVTKVKPQLDTIEFHLFHVPGIGWVASSGNLELRFLVKQLVSAIHGSYDRSWLQRLCPGLNYHFQLQWSTKNLKFVGTTHVRSGEWTEASAGQVIL